MKRILLFLALVAISTSVSARDSDYIVIHIKADKFSICANDRPDENDMVPCFNIKKSQAKDSYFVNTINSYGELEWWFRGRGHSDFHLWVHQIEAIECHYNRWAGLKGSCRQSTYDADGVQVNDVEAKAREAKEAEARANDKVQIFIDKGLRKYNYTDGATYVR